MIYITINNQTTKHCTNSTFVAISRAIKKQFGQNKFFYETSRINPLLREGYVGHPTAPGVIMKDTSILAVEIN